MLNYPAGLQIFFYLILKLHVCSYFVYASSKRSVETARTYMYMSTIISAWVRSSICGQLVKMVITLKPHGMF